MADSSGGTRVPQSFGEKLSFSFPVILVNLILAVGVAFGLVAYMNGSTREELTEKMNKAVGEEKLRSEKATAELEKKNADLQTSVEKISTANAELTKANGLLKTELTTVSGTVAANKAEYKAESKAFTENVKGDFSETKESINKVETRVIYIEKKINEIDKIQKEVDGLKGDTALLKGEYKILHADLEKTKVKTEITDKDLTELSERARQFQMRVLAARAQQAATAARETDLKNLLERLGDVEGANK